MDIEFADEELDRLETDPGLDAGLPVGVVRGYRKVIGWIRAAQDERDLRQMRSLRFEKLRGNRSHQHSMRLNINTGSSSNLKRRMDAPELFW